MKNSKKQFKDACSDLINKSNEFHDEWKYEEDFCYRHLNKDVRFLEDFNENNSINMLIDANNIIKKTNEMKANIEKDVTDFDDKILNNGYYMQKNK